MAKLIRPVRIETFISFKKISKLCFIPKYCILVYVELYPLCTRPFFIFQFISIFIAFLGNFFSKIFQNFKIFENRPLKTMKNPEKSLNFFPKSVELVQIFGAENHEKCRIGPKMDPSWPPGPPPPFRLLIYIYIYQRYL